MLRATLTGLLAATCLAQDPYKIVALPDTQYYSQSYPEIFLAQTQWLASNWVQEDIRFVSHLGDIVNEAATLWQWDNAATAMDQLDAAGIPYGTCVGNHDVLYPGSYFDPTGENYRAYFGPQFYVDEPWFGGASPSGLSNYQVLDIDGQGHLFLHLVVETPPEELVWAQGVLNEHRDHLVWLSTHRYLFLWGPLGGGRYDDFNYFFEPPYLPNGVKADDLFHNFIAPNRQIFLVHCGHNDGEYRQISDNDFGLPVHEVLADYQTTFGNGGNGWLRILEFHPADDRIDVRTYSPSLNDSRTGSDSQFSLPVAFDDYVSGAPFLRFQEGVDGYDGTVDTWINEAEPTQTNGDAATLWVDNDVENSAFSDSAGQSLLRFRKIFQDPVTEADPAPTKVPRGAQITNATLVLNLEDDVDIGNPTIWVYGMTTAWGDNATWDSLDGGINVGVDTDPNLVASFASDNDPDSDYGRTVDVTSAVQGWSNGAPNRGFAFLSESPALQDDGIEIRSSEDGTTALRPSLNVEFTYVAANVPPAIDQPLTANKLVLPEGATGTLTVGATDPNPLDPLVFRLNGVDVGFATGTGVVKHKVLFDDDGLYTFTAEVEDDEAVVSAGSVTVEVLNVAPWDVEIAVGSAASGGGGGAGGAGAAMGARAGQALRLSVRAQDSPFDELSARWDLDDDGTFDDASGFDTSWVFPAPGRYPVRAEVSDDDGGRTAALAWVVVR